MGRNHESEREARKKGKQNLRQKRLSKRQKREASKLGLTFRLDRDI